MKPKNETFFTLLLITWITCFSTMNVCIANNYICSGIYTGEDSFGTLDDLSQNSYSYFPSESCTTLIIPPCATTITLNFTQFRTEANHDSITIYDGTSTSGTMLLHASGTILPPPITAISGAMLIIWTTDSLVSDSGYTANWTITSSSILVPNSCYPYADQACCGIGISNFRINQHGLSSVGIDNTSETNRYADFSCSDSMTIFTNTLYDYSVTMGFGYTQNVKAWIDLNNDGVFDPVSERFINDSAILTNAFGSFMIDSLSLPSGIYGQPLRLRIMSDFSGNPPPAPCSNLIYGDVEDYAIYLDKPVGINYINYQTDFPFKVFTNLDDKSIHIEYILDKNSNVQLKIVSVLNNDCKLFEATSIQNSGKHNYEVYDLAAGVYVVNIIVSDKVFQKKVLLLN